MKDDVEKMIGELKKEMESLVNVINQTNNNLNDLKTQYIRKQGALSALKVLMKVKEK